ncbi:hypothetical protein LPJ77_000709 [Coemansia sp. RSA 2523]|nr:hypothetical protein LPJ77_000709 [Coemansia sp. RSA 2523]
MEEVTDNTYLSDISYLSQEDIVNGTVDISGCRLTCIFPQIGHFSNITHMQLSDNLLTVLPDDIGHLRQLQYIDISYNQLETLPATIAYWQSLRVMKADSNCLTGLPMSIRHIPQLCEVDLSANLLETVPAGLWTMHSLHTLNLSYNLIRVVPARIFAPNGTAAQNSTKKDALCLDGCPIGSGFADCIDKPSTVYTSRFSHGVAIHDPNGPIQPNHKRLPSLSDIVVCKMANNNAAYPHSLLEHIQARLDKLLICDYSDQNRKIISHRYQFGRFSKTTYLTSQIWSTRRSSNT